MEFKIVTSPLDGEYNPVSQFNWLVKQGLLEPKKEYSEIENLRKNEIFCLAIENLVASLKMIDADTNPKRVGKLFDIFEDGFEQLDYYTSKSSDAIITFLDILIDKNEVLEQFDYEIEFHERFVTNYFELFSKPEIPRPVLWHIVNSYLDHDSFITSRGQDNYMGHAITENPLSGDVIVFALLQHKVGKDKAVEDVPLLGTNQLFWNPSVTIRTLERLAPWYMSVPIHGMDTLNSLDFLSLGETFNFDFDKYGKDFYISNDTGNDLAITEFAFITARMMDEIKLGRLRIEELASSRSEILRTIAFFWPEISAEVKAQALELGVVNINTVAEQFLTTVAKNPQISAINFTLQNRVLP